jgi:hypothetical protein
MGVTRARDHHRDPDHRMAAGIFAFHVGNLIHVLLVIAIIVVLVRIIQGRRPI